MELSLMTINLARNLFFDENFQPRPNPDVKALESILKLACDAGYKAVDMTDMECARFGAGTVKALLDNYHLSCASVILFEDYICEETLSAARVRAHTFKAIDDAEQIGCKTIMLVASKAYPEMPWEHMRENLAKNLKIAVDYGAEKGITVCVEDFPSTTVPMCASADMEYLFSRVPGLKLTYDTANMLVEGEDPKTYYECFKNCIGYCHLKDVRIAGENESYGDAMRDGRKMITTRHGDGIVDFETVLGWFKEDGYKGYLSVEYAPDGIESDICRTLINEREYLESLL